MPQQTFSTLLTSTKSGYAVKATSCEVSLRPHPVGPDLNYVGRIGGIMPGGMWAVLPVTVASRRHEC